MQKVMKFFGKIDNILAGISSVILFVMMGWIFTDVILRSFFNQPITGTLELTGEYFMVIIVFLSLSYTQKKDGHIRVTLFEEKFPLFLKKITRIITNICGAAVILIINYLNFLNSIEYVNSNIRSTSLLNYPLAPAVALIAIGLFVLSLRLILDSIMILKSPK